MRGVEGAPRQDDGVGAHQRDRAVDADIDVLQELLEIIQREIGDRDVAGNALARADDTLMETIQAPLAGSRIGRPICRLVRGAAA